MKKYYLYIGGILLAGMIGFAVLYKRRSISAALNYINIQEIGNNQGWTNKVFEQMMKDVGWSSGESWCMYFVKAVFLSVYPGRADQINKVLTPSTQQSWLNAKSGGIFKVVTEGKPHPGDIIIWQSTKNASLGHTGIVWKHISGDNWTTIEGNSSFDGAREGQGVVKGNRILVPGVTQGTLKVLGFLRLKLL